LTVIYKRKTQYEKLFQKLSNEYNLVKIKLPYIKYPIFKRSGTTDEKVYNKVFKYKEYDITINFEPKFIIDCGAYTGFSTVFFKNKFPGSLILAIEPDKSNYDMLMYNTYFYDNIHLFQTAIWSEKNKNLRIKNLNAGKWAFQVKTTESDEFVTFKSITINQLLNKYKQNTIDILKIDIEGTEKEIFTHNFENWLDKVRIIIIELHDNMIPGCSKTFFNAIKKYNFKYYKKGENIIAYKN